MQAARHFTTVHPGAFALTARLGAWLVALPAAGLVALCPTPATAAGNADPRSPLGVWRGTMECGSERWGMQITISSEAATAGLRRPEVLVQSQSRTDRFDMTAPLQQGRGPQLGPHFGAEFTASMFFDAPTGRVTINGGQWRSVKGRGLSLIDFDLRLNPDGTMSGAAREIAGTMKPIARGHPAQEDCRRITLARHGGAASLEDQAVRREREGREAPPERGWSPVAGVGMALSCRPPEFGVRLRTQGSAQQLASSAVLPDVLDKLSQALALECPSARTAVVTFEGPGWTSGPFQWPAQDRKLWVWTGADVTAQALPAAEMPSTEMPSLFTEPVATVPLDNRKAVLTQRMHAGMRAYKKATVAGLQTVGTLTYGKGFDWLLQRFAELSTRERDAPAEVRGRAYYLMAMDIGDFIETADPIYRALKPFNAQQTSNHFLVCARLAKLRDCALLSEYFAEWVAGGGGAEARATLATATVPTRDVPAEVQASVAALVAYVDAKDPPLRSTMADARCLSFSMDYRSSSEKVCTRYRQTQPMMDPDCTRTETRTKDWSVPVATNTCNRPIAVDLSCPRGPGGTFVLRARESKDGAYGNDGKGSLAGCDADHLFRP